MLTDADQRFIDMVIDVSRKAVKNGNPPFGALVVDPDGNILLERENTAQTENDITAHPELRAARDAAREYDADFLATCTMYASTEPCGMCSVAIYNSGIGRVVFALSGARLREFRGNPPGALALSSREVFSHGSRPIEVIGPVAEEEALAVHKEMAGGA